MSKGVEGRRRWKRVEDGGVDYFAMLAIFFI